MKYITSILLALIIFSCVTEKKRAEICATCPVVTEVHTEIKDSAWFFTDTVKVPTYISVPGPTIVVPGPCDKLCDKNGKLKPFLFESKHNGIKTKLFSDTTKNQLVSHCDTDSLKAEILKITSEYNRLRSSKSEQTKVITVNELTKWQKFILSSGYLLWILIIIFVGYKLFKIYKKLKP